MPRQFPPRELPPGVQRVSALLLLVAALALAYWGLIEPWLIAPQQEINEQMADLRQAQRRYSALLGQREQLREQAEAAQSQPQAEASLLPGDDRSAAAAALLQYGAEVIGRHQADGAGCELLNRTPMADAPGNGPFPQVQASFNLSCAMEPVEAILFDLETARPVVFVNSLRIERPAQLEGKQAGGRLEVQLTVAGYLQQSASPPVVDEGGGS